MIDLGDKGLLLFDGDCGVCRKLAEWASWRDGGRYFRVDPYFEFSEEQLAPYGLTWADCTRAVQLITSEGKVVEVRPAAPPRAGRSGNAAGGRIGMEE